MVALAAAGSPALPDLLARFFESSDKQAVVYLPDERTVVVAPEEQIRGLIDRLRDGRPIAPPPPGWGTVDRGLVAISFKSRGEGVPRTVPFRALPFIPHSAVRLLNAADRLTVGVGGGRPFWVRVAGSWSDVRSPAAAAAAAFVHVQRYAYPNREHPDRVTESDALAALRRGRFTLRRLGFEYTADLPGDPIREVVAAFEEDRAARAAAFYRQQRQATAEPAKAAEPEYVRPGHEGLTPIAHKDRPGLKDLPPIPPALPKKP